MHEGVVKSSQLDQGNIQEKGNLMTGQIWGEEWAEPRTFQHPLVSDIICSSYYQIG